VSSAIRNFGDRRRPGRRSGTAAGRRSEFAYRLDISAIPWIARSGYEKAISTKSPEESSTGICSSPPVIEWIEFARAFGRLGSDASSTIR